MNRQFRVNLNAKGIYYPTRYDRDVRQTAFFLRQVFFKCPILFESIRSKIQ